MDLKRSSPKHRDCSSELYTQGTPNINTSVQNTPEKHQIIEDINNIESSLTCLMTNSPKIKRLIKDLKMKNGLRHSKKKDTHPELDAAQQLLLRALNENLKKSLQEKKVVNIRNSYKFVLGTPPQPRKNITGNKTEENRKGESVKTIQKSQQTANNIVQPLKNKLKSL